MNKPLYFSILSLLLMFVLVPSLDAQKKKKKSPVVDDYSDLEYLHLLEEDGTIFFGGDYFSIEELTIDGDSTFLLKFYHYDIEDNCTVISAQSYSDIDLTRKHGRFTYSGINGRLLEEGSYADNKKVGEWKYYSYESGVLTRTEDFGNGNKEIEIFTKVDEMPRFPGCEKEKYSIDKRYTCAETKFFQYIFSMIEYPEYARFQRIEGVCDIEFTVSKEGLVTDPHLVNDIGGECGLEALRTFIMMKAENHTWIPGLQNGETQNVLYQIPITFQLNYRSKLKSTK